MVLGFVALTCSEIDIRNGHGLADCEQASHYNSLPAIKIARLAIDSRRRQRGIGSNSIAHTLDIAIGQITPAVGCRFIIIDTKKEAISFYLNQGFTLLDTEDNKKRETKSGKHLLCSLIYFTLCKEWELNNLHILTCFFIRLRPCSNSYVACYAPVATRTKTNKKPSR